MFGSGLIGVRRLTENCPVLCTRGLCAIIQAETSTGSIDFDYKAYAQKRLAEYWEWRNVEDGRDDGEGMWTRERFWERE